VLEWTAMPESQECRYFVESGSLARQQCKRWIGPNRPRHDVLFLRMIRRDLETFGGSELVVRESLLGIVTGGAAVSPTFDTRGML
jgi:hypothetical protein